MEYKRLGKSGMNVSRIIVGCMGFGDPSRGTHEWALGIDEARLIIKQALEVGVTTFDTANIYSLGASEEIVGQVLFELTRRDDVIIATKVNGRMGPGPKDAGLSRAAIVAQVEQSLKRLKTDYIDLYQIHSSDPTTPIEETLEALHDLVKSGKVRYLGACNLYAWQCAQAQYVADLHGWTRFVSMQNQYNLFTREDEREMVPFCLDQGVGLIPWSPLARGLLTREGNVHTHRSETDKFTKAMYSQAEEANRQIVETVKVIAEERQVPMAQIGLAWLLQKEAVTAPIVGMTKPQHLMDAVAAVNLKLSDEESRRLEAPSIPS
jgi:aryl-alcohol dehydrogenase-like predicted oxidoreductase